MDHKPILYPVSEAGSWGDCIRRRQAVLVNDYQVPHSGKKGLPEGHVPIRRFLAVPVLDGGRVVAAAAVANKAKDYTQDDVTAFTSLVDKMWEILRRRQAEEALRQTRDYLDNLINHANAPIIVWDPSFRITQFNRAFENLAGYSAQEVIGQKLDLLFPEASCEESLSKIARTSSGEYWEAVEIPILRKDGDTRIALWNSANIHAEDGATLVATIAQGHDITARKQAVQALRDERQRFLALLEEMPATVTLLAPDYTILFGNRQLREIFGDPQGRTCYEYVYGRQTPCDDCNLRDILEGQKLMEWERTFHGRIHQVYTYPFADIDGSLMILKMGIDITERKRAEEAFISLVSQAPMGIFIIQNGKFIVINPGFEAITGYRKEELLGQESACLAIPSHKEMVSREATKRLKGESSTPFEFQFVTKSGEIRWGIETIAPTQFEETRASLGYFMDITEHKQLEEQFLQAQKMEAVARLAGGVAHDFNNILSVIFGYGDLMNQTLRPQDPLAGYLAKIREASDRAAVLTSQLLAFCRKTILAPQILNLNDQLAGVEHMLERLIGEDIEIRMVLDPALEPVKADPGQVDQIVMNLAINARDAMPSGGNLTLETANVYLDEDYARGHTYVTPGHYVMLAVTDNGQGMDAETQAHVFEPFFTTKELGRGTGLGLSTVYGIVKQSGGHIAVYSEVGQGTTFKVYLPRVQEAVAAVSEAKPLAMDLHGSETILVVEDEDMLREIIGRSLKIYGYSVLKARHGGEALLLCERHPEPIHLMLTDVVMPNMNGRELADRLAPLRPDMKVLYMSGYTDNAIVHHGVLETDIFFVQKPFRTKKLIEKIREILGESLPKP
jgi:PAS domain S-box-containing protein